jgi:hypothetical protein
MAGEAAGHRDAAGTWVADRQPGYYDTRGRWHAGETSGYYDNRGRWVATAVATDRNDRADRQAILSQLAGLDRYVSTARSQRSLSGREAARAQRELYSIRSSERSMGHDRNGNLSARDQAALQFRVDRLTTRLRINSQ